MRKVIVFVLLIICLFMVTGCMTNTTEYYTKGEDCSSSKGNEQGIIFSLDVQYENEKSFCKSNVEHCAVNNKYAEKWHTLGNEYYELIICSEFTANNTEKKEIVSCINNNWQVYATQRISDEQVRLETIYDSGTIIPVKLSQFTYSLYRAYALEMYNMCIELNIYCAVP